MNEILIKKPKFVIGIGSQRAGSTLLHSLMDESTDIFMHPVKELHFFDTLFEIRPRTALVDYSLNQIQREINHLVKKQTYEFIDKRYKCYLRTNNILAFNNIAKIDYLDLYRPCISSSNFLGEITPEYMLLTEPQIEIMRNIIGSDAVIILLCRNPVDRIISAVKLVNSYNNLGMTDSQASNWLKDNIDNDSNWIKNQDKFNDYENTEKRFLKYFSNTIVLSYEKLISQPDVVAKLLEERIGTNVALKDFVDGISIRKNSLGRSFDLNSDLKNILKLRYTDSAEFVLSICANINRT
jgi:hypothetical protein